MGLKISGGGGGRRGVRMAVQMRRIEALSDVVDVDVVVAD